METAEPHTDLAHDTLWTQHACPGLPNEIHEAGIQSSWRLVSSPSFRSSCRRSDTSTAQLSDRRYLSVPTCECRGTPPLEAKARGCIRGIWWTVNSKGSTLYLDVDSETGALGYPLWSERQEWQNPPQGGFPDEHRPCSSILEVPASAMHSHDTRAPLPTRSPTSIDPSSTSS
jgi:hypothetical protein